MHECHDCTYLPSAMQLARRALLPAAAPAATTRSRRPTASPYLRPPPDPEPCRDPEIQRLEIHQDSGEQTGQCYARESWCTIRASVHKGGAKAVIATLREIAQHDSLPIMRTQYNSIIVIVLPLRSRACLGKNKRFANE